MRSRLWIHWVAVFILLLAVQAAGRLPQAEAHIGTLGYSDIRVGERSIDYTLYLEAREVEQWVIIRSKKAIVIDPNAPAVKQGPSWTEQDILRLLGESLQVTNNGIKGDLRLNKQTIEQKNGMDFVKLELSYSFAEPIRDYAVHYTFFFDVDDPQHQNFVTLTAKDGQPLQKVFNAQMRELTGKVTTAAAKGTETVEIAIPSWLITFKDYVVTGMLHIWTGYDHLLFLLGLLILKQPARAYVKVLTAFTVGHSITLALSALDIVRAPLSVIEPLIALSIVVVAIENIWLKRLDHRWLIALLFGFIHGFGFADILHGALGEHYLLALFSFNLGVEAGQLAVLAVLLPALIYMGKVVWYPRALYGISGFIALLGAYWFVARII